MQDGALLQSTVGQTMRVRVRWGSGGEYLCLGQGQGQGQAEGGCASAGCRRVFSPEDADWTAMCHAVWWYWY